MNNAVVYIFKSMIAALVNKRGLSLLITDNSPMIYYNLNCLILEHLKWKQTKST